MPKGKRKNKTADKRRCEVIGSDDESQNETASVVSTVSDIRSVCDEGTGADSEEVEVTEQEVFEEKLKEAIDGLSQKSTKGRQMCLEGLLKALSSKYVPEFIDERRETLTDGIKTSLKKGKGEEQGTAAMLAVLLCIQLGYGNGSDLVFADLCPLLLAILNDVSISSKARAKIATSLGLCAFVVGETEAFATILASLESVFSASCLKGNGTVPNHALEMTTLHSSALAAWSLLLTVRDESEIYALANRHLNQLTELLESPDVDLRITAGETIALFYEVVRDHDDNFEGDNLDDLVSKLRDLSTDSHKYRAKKDRKQQRSSFRDILKAVQDRAAPNIQVKFGQEVLELSNWRRKRQYDALCNVVGSGMNLHLTENELIREIFELGAPLPTNGLATIKISKFKRHMGNVAAFKARTLARNKVRDKRSVMIM